MAIFTKLRVKDVSAETLKYIDENKDNCAITLSDPNHQVSSQKFWQITIGKYFQV